MGHQATLRFPSSLSPFAERCPLLVEAVQENAEARVQRTHTPHVRARKHTRTHTPHQVRANAVMRREEDRVTTGEKAFVDALERHNLQAFDKTLSPSTLAATSDVPAQVPARV